METSICYGLRLSPLLTSKSKHSDSVLNVEVVGDRV